MLSFPAFTDSHVHIGLIDGAALAGGGIGRVLDLGWDPALASTWRSPRVDIAGPLLAAPGGYPLTSGWAPVAATREIADAAGASSAIADLQRWGARVAKITLNSEAGPIWDDDLLGVVVRLAHGAGLPVVAHAQGARQAQRALDAGVDALAHTPWTETLSDGLIERMATRMSWISTLDIHGWGAYGADHARAVGNLERFVAAGGMVHYGTDLGNGALPTGLNRRELEGLAGAGMTVPQLLSALRGLLPPAGAPTSVIAGAETLDDLTIDDLMKAVVTT